MSKSSINIKPCKIGTSEEHNRRDAEYMAHIKKKNIYIRQDLTCNNEAYTSPELQGMTLSEYYDRIGAMVKAKTGRKMQTGQRQRKDKKTGKIKTIEGCSPLREAVVNIKEETTMADLHRLCDAINDRWGVRAVQIFTHRDEGHYENPEDAASWVPNYHAQIVFDWMDWETGKSRKLNEDDITAMQDLAAEVLGMERGESKSITHREHEERDDYVRHKQEDKLRLAQEQAQKAEQDKQEALAEKEKAEQQKSAAETAVAEINKEKDAVIAERNKAYNEHAKAVAAKSKANSDRMIAEDRAKDAKQSAKQLQEKCDELDGKYTRLVGKYNGLVEDYNATLEHVNSWREAQGWQKWLVDTIGESMYKGDKLVNYCVNELAAFAKNDDGKGGHQDFLHDNQSAAIKALMLQYSTTDKSVWQNIAAWLLSLAIRFCNLTAYHIRRASTQLDDLVNGKYDSRINSIINGLMQGMGR